MTIIVLVFLFHSVVYTIRTYVFSSKKVYHHLPIDKLGKSTRKYKGRLFRTNLKTDDLIIAL